ncbi:caspase, EACC1-associated type [Streptomyces sp. MMS24-I29]|uniref:caspase, EACC1-associated type n=1 Tax=Streptomyces sp. MMS24-I29 TaxID=3351480 RepID=UPI003C7C39F8
MLIGAGTFRDPELPGIPAVRTNLDDLRLRLTHPEHGLLAAEHCQTVADPRDQAAVGSALTAAVREAEDLLLVYYCGHGILDDTGVLHFALTGTDTEHVGFSAIHVDLVKRMVGGARAKARVLLLDCCFSGQAVTVMSRRKSLALAQLDLTGTYTLTSTPATSLSHAPLGARNTAFTGALLDALHIPGPLTLDQIHQYIEQELASRGLPRPQRRSVGAAGNLTLTRGPIKPPPLPTIPFALQREPGRGIRGFFNRLTTYRPHDGKQPSAAVKTRRALLVTLMLAVLQSSTLAPNPGAILDHAHVSIGYWDDSPSGREKPYNKDVALELLKHANFKGEVTFAKVTPFAYGGAEGYVGDETLASREAEILSTVAMYPSGMRSYRDYGYSIVGPLTYSQAGILTLRQKKSIKKLSDLSGKTVCFVTGSSVAYTLAAEAKANFFEGGNMSECLSHLVDQSVDAISGDRLVLAGLQSTHSNRVKVIDGIRSKEGIFMGFAIPEGDRDTCVRLRDALQKYVSSEDWKRDFRAHHSAASWQDTAEALPTSEQIKEISCKAQ